MPFPQNTPPQVPPSERGLGSSSTTTLKKAFAGPINGRTGQFASVEELRKFYEDLSLTANPELVGDVAAYYGITDWSPDFNKAPNLSNVKTGPAGLPGTPYIPNIASPGEGSLNPADLPEPPEGIGLVPSNVPGSGVPITENDPSQTSKSMGTTKVGQGMNKMGKSKASI
jgi:hypothetical protein